MTQHRPTFSPEKQLIIANIDFLPQFNTSMNIGYLV